MEEISFDIDDEKQKLLAARTPEDVALWMEAILRDVTGHEAYDFRVEQLPGEFLTMDKGLALYLPTGMTLVMPIGIYRNVDAQLYEEINEEPL